MICNANSNKLINGKLRQSQKIFYGFQQSKILLDTNCLLFWKTIS